jgi:hypothetical protein
MKKVRLNGASHFAALLLGTISIFAGCEAKGVAQRAGQNIDKGIQDAKDAINPPGPMEKAGRSIDKVVNP